MRLDFEFSDRKGASLEAKENLPFPLLPKGGGNRAAERAARKTAFDKHTACCALSAQAFVIRCALDGNPSSELVTAATLPIGSQVKNCVLLPPDYSYS